MFKADSQVSTNRKNKEECFLRGNISLFNSVLLTSYQTVNQFMKRTREKERFTVINDLGPTTQDPMGTQDPTSNQNNTKERT